MASFQGQYVVAKFDLPSGAAHLVSVTTPTDVLKVRIPSRFHDLLEAAKSRATQTRFLFTVDTPEGAAAGAMPMVTDASVVESDGSEQPIVTRVGVWFCLEEPFDFSTGQWAPILHGLRVRNSTTAVRGLVSEKCLQVLRQREQLDAGHALFRFDAVDDFRESDANLFDNLVSPQVWLDRATLADIWRQSSWTGRENADRPFRLPSCPPGSHQEANIQMLRESFISSCSPAFAAFQESATGSPDSQYFMSETGSNAREKHTLLDVAGESHMDRVLRALQQDCWGDGHPFTASFEEARRLRNPAGMVPEREIPFIIKPKKVGSFHVLKEYVARIRDIDVSDWDVSSGALVQTSAFNCRTHDSSHWTPYFQNLTIEAERDPRLFRRAHPNGIVYGDHSLASHATQVLVCEKSELLRREGGCFLELWQHSERDDTDHDLAAIERDLAALQMKGDSAAS
jgi:hypothetical protein